MSLYQFRYVSFGNLSLTFVAASAINVVKGAKIEGEVEWETGEWGMGTGNWELEIGDWRLETAGLAILLKLEGK